MHSALSNLLKIVCSPLSPDSPLVCAQRNLAALMPSHLQSATIQAAILNISSSVLAQLLTAYRNADSGTSSSSLNPLGLDFVAILQYLISNLLLTPPNFLWQEYLEKTFPGYPVQKGKQKMKVDEDGNVRLPYSSSIGMV